MFRLALFPLVAVVFALGCSKPSPSETDFGKVSEALVAAEWPADGLVATSSIQLGTSTRVTATRVTVRPANGFLSLGAGATVVGSARANGISMDSGASITGNAHYNTRSGGTVGSVTTPLSVPVSIQVPTMPTVSPGGQAVGVAAGAVATLPSGAYSTATVNGRLILTGGVYHFSSVTVAANKRLECSSDCEVRVAAQVDVGEFAFIGASGAGLTPRNMRIVVKGANDGHTFPAAMRVGPEAQLVGYVFAPNGTLRLGLARSVDVKGKIVAKDVIFGVGGVAMLMDAPTVSQQPTNANVINGQPATFSVVATGDGLTYQWKRNGSNIAGATSASLSFTANTSLNNSTYTVVVTNAAGSVTSSSATLTVSCASSDTTCDGQDSDCDGSVDEDYVPSCGAGAQRLACIGGTVVSTPCVDSTVCNGAETCSAGICVAGTPLVVDDNKVCTIDACNPSSGVSHTPRAAGTSCSDSLSCNGAAVCNSSGTCQPGTPLPYGLETGCCDPDADAYLWQTAPVDPTVVTTYAARAMPLFVGDDRSQAPLDEEVIDTGHVSIVSGRVVNESGAPVSCVQVGVLHQDEIGSVRTLADGTFALAVNGGEVVTLQYAHPSFMTAHRDVATQPLKDAFALDVKLIPYGLPQAVSASATSTTIVTGEKETDVDGIRKATMLVPPGTSATVEGESTARQNYEIRVKEVTNRAEVGRDGMLASLPPQSMFTYAVSFDLAGAENKDVVLNKEIPVYVENFLNFPVGETVPVGRYDAKTEAWIAQESGVVIKILGQDTAGRAKLDLNSTSGEDNVANFPQLGITDAERVTLAQRYGVNATLWRFRVKHFSLWDANWPGAPDPGDTQPDPPPPDDNDGDNNDDDDDGDEAPGPDGPNSCQAAGSIIQCERQVLMEQVQVHGAPFGLRYSSARQPGYGRQLNIPLTGPTVPARVTRVELKVQVAGREFETSYAPAPNLTHAFSWDGRDSSGRILSGRQKVSASIGFTYPIAYQRTDKFGYNGNGIKISADMSRGEITLWRDWSGEVGAVSAQYSGLGGWTVDIHHALDRDTGRVYLGSGGGFKVPDDYSELVNVAGTGFSGFSGDGLAATQAAINLNGNSVNSSIAVVGDGTFYFSDPANNRVRRVTPDGIISTLAGGGSTLGDGGVATLAKLDNPSAITLGPDGHLYVADSLQHRIRKINLDTNIITTVVGTGVAGATGDAVPGNPSSGVATQATLNKPTGLTIAPDGTMFIADSSNGRIRRVRDGIITTVVSGLAYPTGVAVAPDGAVFFSEFDAQYIKKLSTSSVVSIAVGTGDQTGGTWPYGDGGPGPSAQLLRPDGLVFGPDGLLYFVDKMHHLVRRVNARGLVESLVGTGIAAYFGDNLPVTRSPLNSPRGLTVAPDGSVYVVDTGNQRIRRARPFTRLTTASGNLLVPLQDGAQLAEFDGEGRHRRTLDAYTGATVFEFGYTGSWLTEVKDVDGRSTLIHRDSTTGRADMITSPDGHVTSLDIQFGPDGDTLNELEQPDGGRYLFGYAAGDGLLTSMRDPKLEAEGGTSFTFEYTNGRLTKDTDPLGGAQRLSHSYAGGARTVTRTTPLGVPHTYKVTSDGQSYQRTIGNPDGTQNVTDIRSDLKPTFVGPNGTSYDERIMLSDGSTAYYSVAPAPVWGLNAPVTSEKLLVLPSGKTRKEQSSLALTFNSQTSSLASETRTKIINGRSSTVKWDGALRRFEATSAAGRKHYAILDAKGRVVETGVPDRANIHFPTYFYYDTDGRLEAVERGSRTTTFEYYTTAPTKGALWRVTNPLQQETQFGYDNAGVLSSVTTPDDVDTAFGFDANGNLTAVTPPTQPLHNQKFDALNQQTKYIPPALSGVPVVETQFTYNADRNLDTVVRPEAGTVRYSPDAAGRIDWIQTPAGITDYAYYAAAPPAGGAPGALQSISAPNGVQLGFTYDGPLVKTTTLSGAGLKTTTVARDFDTDLRVSSESMTTTAGTTTLSFGYDADSFLKCVSVAGCADNDQAALRLSYSNVLSRLETATMGKTNSSWLHDSYGMVRSTQTWATLSGSNFSFLQDLSSPARDELGRIRGSRIVNGGTSKLTEYTYDLQGRLETVTEDSVLTETFAYDDNGNRLSVTTPAGVTSAAYDDQDRLQSFGAFTYTYTAAGDIKSKFNTTTNERWEYTYDALGNLVKVKLPNQTVIDYLVDGKNRRVGKKVNGTLVKQWVWSSQLRIAAELDGSGQVLSRFLYGNQPTTPEAVVRSNGTYRIVSDHLGSPRALVNVQAPADVILRLSYKAFGEVSGTGIGTIPQGFAGGLYDADTGLVRFGARDYDPVVGRWVSKDPILFRGGQANLYVYVGNDPINLIDPSGREWAQFLAIGLMGAGSVVRFANPVLGYSLMGLGAALELYLILSEESGAEDQINQIEIELKPLRDERKRNEDILKEEDRIERGDPPPEKKKKRRKCEK